MEYLKIVQAFKWVLQQQNIPVHVSTELVEFESLSTNDCTIITVSHILLLGKNRLLLPQAHVLSLSIMRSLVVH